MNGTEQKLVLGNDGELPEPDRETLSSVQSNIDPQEIIQFVYSELAGHPHWFNHELEQFIVNHRILQKKNKETKKAIRELRFFQTLAISSLLMVIYLLKDLLPQVDMNNILTPATLWIFSLVMTKFAFAQHSLKEKYQNDITTFSVRKSLDMGEVFLPIQQEFTNRGMKLSTTKIEQEITLFADEYMLSEGAKKKKNS
jgi:hypothetical protein